MFCKEKLTQEVIDNMNFNQLNEMLDDCESHCDWYYSCDGVMYMQDRLKYLEDKNNVYHNSSKR